EVQEQGLPIRGQQHVGGLQVEVNQTALMRVLQAVRQASAEAADGVDIRSAGKGLEITAAAWKAQRRFLLSGFQRVRQGPACALGRRLTVQELKDPCECGAAEERHAQGAEIPVRKVVDGVERDDVRMLEPRER